MSVVLVRIICMIGLLAATVSLALIGGYMGLFLSGSIGFVLIYMIVMSLWMSRGDILAERMLHQQRIQAGDQVEVTITIRLPGRYWFCWMVVEERWVKQEQSRVPRLDGVDVKAVKAVKAMESTGIEEAVDEQYACVAFIQGDREVKYHYTTSAKARGLYRVHSSRVVIGDMFGLVKRVLVQEEQEAEIVQVNPAPLAGSWFKCLRLVDVTPSDYGTLRDYMSGDPISSIDWKSYARYQKLKTKQLEVEESKSMLIVMDARKDYFETIVSAVTRIVMELNNSSIEFVLACGDSRCSLSARNSLHSEVPAEIYKWLATIESVSLASFDGQLKAALAYSGTSSIEAGAIIGLTASPDERHVHNNHRYGHQQSIQLLYVPHNGNGELIYA